MLRKKSSTVLITKLPATGSMRQLEFAKAVFFLLHSSTPSRTLITDAIKNNNKKHFGIVNMDVPSQIYNILMILNGWQAVKK